MQNERLSIFTSIKKPLLLNYTELSLQLVSKYWISSLIRPQPSFLILSFKGLAPPYILANWYRCKRYEKSARLVKFENVLPRGGSILRYSDQTGQVLAWGGGSTIDTDIAIKWFLLDLIHSPVGRVSQEFYMSIINSLRCLRLYAMVSYPIHPFSNELNDEKDDESAETHHNSRAGLAVRPRMLQMHNFPPVHRVISSRMNHKPCPYIKKAHFSKIEEKRK